jgi:hypothetical protein
MAEDSVNGPGRNVARGQNRRRRVAQAVEVNRM